MKQRKFEVECKNQDCKHKFKESLKEKTTDSILICPKCGFEFPFKDADIRTVGNVIALLDEKERCVSKKEK